SGAGPGSGAVSLVGFAHLLARLGAVLLAAPVLADRLSHMSRPGYATLCCSDLGAPARVACRCCRDLPHLGAMLWATAQLGTQLAGPLCGRADAQGLAPVQDRGEADSPPVCHRYLGLAHYDLGKIAKEDDGAPMAARTGLPHGPGDRPIMQA